MNIHKAGMLRFATIDLQLVVRSSSSCPEASREKISLFSHIHLKNKIQRKINIKISKMNVVPAKTDFCMKCIFDMKQRDNALRELDKYFMEEQKWIENTYYKSCDKERKTEMLIQECNERRQAIEESMFRNCLRACVQKVHDGTRLLSIDAMDCETCSKFQEELTVRDNYIKDLEDDNNKTRSELDQWKKKHQIFRERMSIEASVEIGTSGEIFEDISNPCRESELRSSYNKMRTTMWPICLKEIEKKSMESKEETVDKSEEKERIKRMIKEVFTKAADDMKEKKTALESFFEISDKTADDRKQKQCFEMAVQSLQLMIFWKECTLYQDMYKQLGHSSPDYLCKLADRCYKQGCLMALHNPPLTPDWDKSDNACPFPPITRQSMQKMM